MIKYYTKTKVFQPLSILRTIGMFAILSLIGMQSANAQYTAIPDVNFEQRLISLGIDSGTVDHQVLTSAISGITSLDVQNRGIANLTGIEGFTALTHLNCSRNSGIRSLNLSANTSLTNLSCQLNSLSNLDVTANTALIYLNCGINSISNLDLSANTALIRLYCHSNLLSSLSLTTNTALDYLECYDNSLNNLDISTNTALTFLSCGINSISSLDVSTNTALTELHCGGNLLSSLDVSANTALRILFCDNNLLSNINVSSNTALESLYCSSNSLSSLNVSSNTALIDLGCKNNLLSSLDLTLNTNLAWLHCFQNPSLNCITVANPAAAAANPAFRKDASASYSTNCEGLPTSKVKENQCSTTLAALNTVITGEYVAGYQAYRFEVSNGTTVNTFDSNTNSFNLTNLSGTTYGTAYSIRVAVQIAGVWGNYGKPCIVTTPTLTGSLIPTTSVLPTICGTTLATIGANIAATPVYGATSYRFEITTSGITTVYYSSTPNFNLVDAGVAISGCSFTIRVAALIGEIVGNYGASCKVDRPALTFPTVASICAGDMIAPLPTTSNDGITGTWSPALNNLLTTNYLFTPDAGQCPTTATMTIKVYPVVTPIFTQVATICSGGFLAPLPVYSNNKIVGKWSPALNNLATTTYTFTPNAGQCAPTVTMTIIVRAPGTITGGDVTVCAPGTALNSNGVATVFTNSTTLTLNGNSAGSTVQWQRSFNFSNAANATPAWSTVATSTAANIISGNTVTVAHVTTTVWYRARVTNGSCVSFADPVKIAVTPLARAGAITSSSSVCAGGSITFTSAAYTGSAIAWEVSTTSATAGFSTVAGENGLTYTMNNAPSTRFYVRTVVTSGACSMSRSAVKTITVNPISVGGTIAGGGTVCSGSDKLIRIAGCIGAIQWMYATDGINFINVPTRLAVAPTFATTSISGAASTYAVNNITGTTFFKAVVRSGLCSVAESNTVQYTVAAAATAGTASAAASSVCPNEGTTISLVGYEGTITWQKSTNPNLSNPTWTTITGAVNPILNTGNLTVRTAFRARLTIGNCAPIVTSNVVLVSINCTTGSKQVDSPTEIAEPFSVVAYPNPSNNVFNFKVNGANDETVSILVFDMTGRQIENKVVNASDIENIALGQNYSSGVYNVIVAQGMNTKTVRLVKK